MRLQKSNLIMPIPCLKYLNDLLPQVGSSTLAQCTKSITLLLLVTSSGTCFLSLTCTLYPGYTNLQVPQMQHILFVVVSLGEISSLFFLTHFSQWDSFMSQDIVSPLPRQSQIVTLSSHSNLCILISYLKWTFQV